MIFRVMADTSLITAVQLLSSTAAIECSRIAAGGVSLV